MYTLSCLQVAYEFLNREWMYLIYGDQKKTYYKTLKTKIDHLYFYLLNLINPKNRNDWYSKDKCEFLFFIIVMTLGIVFTTYKVMKILHSPEVKNIMESQWRRNENSNKTSPAFHEDNNNNNNENAEITNDFPGGTSLTAIVKPTIHQENSDNENSSDSDVNGSSNDIIMNFADNFDFPKPLTKCTSSLRVVTSKDSLNEQIFDKLTNFKTKNSKSENNKKNEIEIISNEVNNNDNNETFAIQDTSSVFEVDDCVSSTQDSINPYQYSMLTSPDTQSIRKNSSYVSGHFVENFPDLDLSPIPNISPKNDNRQQSKVEFNDKEIAQSKDDEKSRQKHSLEDEDMKNLSSSKQSMKCLEKSSDFYFSCRDFKSFLSEEIKFKGEKTKISKLNLEEKEEKEEELHLPKSNTPDVSGSKIPIPSTKSNTFFKSELNESLKKEELIRLDKNKDNLRLRESEISLEKFVQLEISTGCCSSSHHNHQSSKKP